MSRRTLLVLTIYQYTTYQILCHQKSAKGINSFLPLTSERRARNRSGLRLLPGRGTTSATICRALHSRQISRRNVLRSATKMRRSSRGEDRRIHLNRNDANQT